MENTVHHVKKVIMIVLNVTLMEYAFNINNVIQTNSVLV